MQLIVDKQCYFPHQTLMCYSLNVLTLNVCYLKVISELIKGYLVIANHSETLTLNINQVQTFKS